MPGSSEPGVTHISNDYNLNSNTISAASVIEYNKTEQQFDKVIKECRDLFEKKTADYGEAWKILRSSTLTDQIFIKAKRIRSIQEKKKQLISDPIRDEFVGIINYCIMAIYQIEEKKPYPKDWGIMNIYDEIIRQIKFLLFAKNHDYGEAWRDMRISSMTDLILMKLLRIKSIEDNEGKTIVSEGVDSGYKDIVNYSVFCLILMKENDK